MATFEQERAGVGPGWQPIIEKLHAALLELSPDYEVLQIKEKFGGLRYYIDFAVPFASPEAKQMQLLLADAEEQSFRVCEDCGTEDGVTVEGRWVRTLCGPCRTSAEERRQAWLQSL